MTHREWENKLGGIVTPENDKDIMNAYADIQQGFTGQFFCKNCNNPFCPDCVANHECCECGSSY
jgi:hypothetical protein